MEPHELFRAVGAAGEPRDGNRRCVRRQDRVRLQMWNEVFKDRGFDVLSLGRGFDHKVGLTKIAERQRRLNALHRFRFGAGRDFFPADLTVEIAFNQGHGTVQRIAADVVHHNIITCKRKHMGDAIPHLPGTDDANRFDVHETLF